MGFFHTIFLFDGFRSVRPSLFGNTLRGGAPAGAGMRIPTPVYGLARNDRLFRPPPSRPTAVTPPFTQGRLWDSAPAGAGMRIPTPVCGLARNDRLFRQPASRPKAVTPPFTQGRLYAAALPRHTGRCGHRPLRRGAAAAYGAMHPKGTCSASLHCVGIAPYIPSAESVCVSHRAGRAVPPLHPVSQRQMHYQSQTSGQRPPPTFATSRQRRDLIIAQTQGWVFPKREGRSSPSLVVSRRGDF